ncbi:sodium-dependent low-affinity dicarboxylate transporter 1-like isoform X3 [Ornithodoros turicata]|uniref:sodium-dependent low-affinity dicarboxylate transporter 1-like isoform X3 n=1 Tax=Ornithodoros turicata TaxID=34597 RepID=UPI003139CE9E
MKVGARVGPGHFSMRPGRDGPGKVGSCRALTRRTQFLKQLGACLYPTPVRNRINFIFGYALPLYLAPFLFGNDDSKCMYCILVTVLSMVGAHLPRAISAFFPVVLMPLSGVMAPDRLASSYIDANVLSASSLFIIVIIGDQSRVFSRIAMHALRTLGCNAHLLFSYLVLITFVSTFLLPSRIVVVIATMLVERTVASLEQDVVIMEHTWNTARKTRGSSDTLEPWADGGSSTTVKGRKSPRRTSRKASSERFGLVMRRTSSVPHLPVRRIPSFSTQESGRLSSILKEPKAPVCNQNETRKVNKELDGAPEKIEDVLVSRRNTSHKLSPPPLSRRQSMACKLKAPNCTPDAHPPVQIEVPEDSSAPPSVPKSSRPSILKVRRTSSIRTVGFGGGSRTSMQSTDTILSRMSIRPLFFRRTPRTYLIEDAGQRMFLPPPPSTDDAINESSQHQPSVLFSEGAQEWQPGSSEEAKKFLKMCINMRAALLLGAAMTSVLGSLASFWNVPARGAIMIHLSKQGEELPVTAWRWFTVTLPVAAAGTAVCWGLIYVVYIITIEDPDNSVVQDVAKSTVSRLRDMRALRLQESLVAYWFLGLPLYYVSFISRKFEVAFLEGSFFGATMIVMMMLPRDNLRLWALRRLVTWDTIKDRMPWNILVMYGSVSSLTKLAKEHNLVKVIFDHMGNKFWTSASTQTTQVILTTVAAVLSEVIGNPTLNDLMVPIVINIASASKTPAVFYVIPVGVAASANVIMPVSLPLLMLRESLQISCSRMIATGLVLKIVVVLTIVITTNTLGILVFGNEDDSDEGSFLLQRSVAHFSFNSSHKAF